jgi:hypothetical protein
MAASEAQGRQKTADGHRTVPDLADSSTE